MTFPGHSGSHQGLLATPQPVCVTDDKVDAIIVPSGRTAPYLRHAASLSQELSCPLVVLCSKLSRRAEVVRHLQKKSFNVDVIAVDIAGAPARLPEFATTEFLAGSMFERRNDVSFKRNLGLALARVVGWSRVVFLDDDMTVPDPADLRRAVGLLRDHDGVGLEIGGYPDNSVVCHAHREAGGWQETFVGGGALAVPTDRAVSFFPDIYNEDWFFLLGESGLGRVTLMGTAKQQPYDPFAHPDRARSEEFGDALAEGVFWLLDRGCSVQEADEAYWRGYLRTRGALIDDVIQRASKLDVDPGQRTRMLRSLRAARGRLYLISPTHCADYLRAWRKDRKGWRQFLKKLPQGLSLEAALRRLGLGSYTRCDDTARTAHAPVRRGRPPASQSGSGEPSDQSEHEINGKSRPLDAAVTRPALPVAPPVSVGAGEPDPAP